MTKTEKRFSADALRAKSKETIQKKRFLASVNKRKLEIWRKLISSAANGSFSVDLPNLSDADIAFLRKTGMYVINKYTRLEDRASVEAKIEEMRADLKNLLLKTRDVVINEEQPYDRIQQICQITESDPSLAYMANIDEWFSEDFDFLWVETLADARDFLKQLDAEHNSTAIPEKKAFLKKLIPHAKKLVALFEYEGKPSKEESALNSKSNELSKRIESLSESDDIRYEPSINCIHEVDWGACDQWQASTEFNPFILFWLSSRNGQNFLSEAEGRIVEAAESGANKITFDIEHIVDRGYDTPQADFDAYRYKTGTMSLAHFGPDPDLFSSVIEPGGSKVTVTEYKSGSYNVTLKW